MLPLEHMTIRDFIRRSVIRYPDRPALKHGGVSVSYSELEKKIIEYAARLLALGIRKGDRVGLIAEPDNESVTAMLAIQYIGAVSVMINTSLSPEDYLSQMEDINSRHLLLGRSFKAADQYAVQLNAHGVPSFVRSISCLGESGDCYPAFSSLRACDAAAVETAADLVTPEDTAMILFTSGSTSRPKAVCTSHYSRINSGIQQADDLHCSCTDAFCIAMPMFHCFCISANIMAALSVGACICMPKDRHTASIISTVRECGCTVLSSVPTMFRALLSKSDFDAANFSTVRIGIIAGAGYSPEDFVKIDAAMGPQFTLMSSLGQTECTAGFTVCNTDDSIFVRSTTLGHFMSHVEGKIADISTGEALPAGQVGEICVRGYVTMQCYANNPEQTALTLDADGWIHTGDLGMLDENGNLSIKGRIKELIIRGGENISPLAVENALKKALDFEECKVVGVPDSHYGEEVCACIVLYPGQSADPEEIRSSLHKYLPAYMVPRYVEFFSSLPKNSAGKIIIADTAAMARERLACK